MKKTTKKIIEPDSYLLDTYRSVSDDNFVAGAILYIGRKKLDTVRFKERFETQEDADNFARNYCEDRGMREAVNEGEIGKIHPAFA